jgi:hypothetical protein
MSEGRGRLVFAAAATVVLVAVVVVVAASGGSEEEGGSDDPCLAEWNDDAIARSDGVHAFEAHGYSATLLTRVDAEGEVIAGATGPPTPEARCAVVFASPVVDSEPDFGVRVFDQGRWAGLALVDRVPLDQIEAMQQAATATANATLLPDGRLAP